MRKRVEMGLDESQAFQVKRFHIGELGAGRTVTVNMTGPAMDYDLYLLNSAGSTLKSSLGTTATESVTYVNSGTTTATYYIRVIGYAGAFTTTTPYNLALSR